MYPGGGHALHEQVPKYASPVLSFGEGRIFASWLTVHTEVKRALNGDGEESSAKRSMGSCQINGTPQSKNGRKYREAPTASPSETHCCEVS